MTKKPVTIALKDLSHAVQQAVAQHQVHAEPGFHIGPIIMGIILRPPVVEIEKASEIASKITAHVGTAHSAALAGSQLEPGVFIRPGGPIICGFVAENITLRE